MRGRPTENVVKKTKYTLQFNNVIYYFDDSKSKNGAYLVEIIDPEFDKIEKLYNKLERLKTPKYHENGRKKRTTEAAYWKEHYRLYPEDKPKKRGRRKKV